MQLAMGHATPIVTLNSYVGHWPDAVDETRGLVAAALGTCTRVVPGAECDPWRRSFTAVPGP